MSYDYEEYTKESSSLLSELEEATLLSVLINVIDPEFNVVYLETDKGIYSLQGEVGGEYLGVHELEELPEITRQDGYIICKYPPFEIFLGKRIIQARQIGTAWNGHGYEISFGGMFIQTMIVQSIYCGDKPNDLEDCLRLGVGSYENTWKT
jgi:hypothetical protein